MGHPPTLEILSVPKVISAAGLPDISRNYLEDLGMTFFRLNFLPPLLATVRFGLVLDEEDIRIGLPVPPFPLVFDSYSVPPQS